MRIPTSDSAPVLIALSLLNLGSLAWSTLRGKSRRRFLHDVGRKTPRPRQQIVDKQGKVRASIKINPSVKQTDG